MATTRGQHLIGKTLGSCVLERLLGYGGSSAVFLAQQEQPRRKVAIKVYLPRTGMDRRMQRDFYRRFLHEAEAASKLDHPNILPIYSYGEEEGLPYIVMPYMEGGTLSQYMAKRRVLSLPEANWYLEQLASALHYAHEHGCVHCDVKPANILLSDKGHVVLSDFGIARLTRTDREGTPTEVNTPNAVMGTPDYISPEQALGHKLDGRSDIYSLAVTLFFLLTRQLPFKADSAIALALMHVHESPPALSLRRADITPGVDRVLQKALAKDPQDRFQTPLEFSQAFSAAVAAAAEKKSSPSRGKYLTDIEGDEDEPLSGPQPVTIVTRQIARRSSWLHSWNGGRLLLTAFSLLLLGIIIGLFVFQSIASRSSRVAHGLATTPTPVVLNLFAKTDNWSDNCSCFFDSTKQSYHVQNNLDNGAVLAQYYGPSMSNFLLTVTLTETRHTAHTADFYGIVFRESNDQGQYYLFEIAPSLSQYAFLRYDNRTQGAWCTIHPENATQGPWCFISTGSAPSLLTGVGQSNVVTIEAKGNHFAFTINGVPMDSSPVDTLPARSTGSFGLFVENQGIEAAFSHFTVRQLP
ncbi:serine/threonine protein kinase [Tengunoibacter tsumagoiensis]|uniref:non-specific serine/threonine protein kinase n=1 Tax=Tengunoibacter tsumagoiensis TaxID=2014871 RepID=A0A402A2E1_9CHLR|nr:serine/threonine-protein kinase [Tengunoibacter tsumagoiensis]GCE13294.1 hypothetical protein KTT_31530 [Tengunoibacter tsumagoiensis]